MSTIVRATKQDSQLIGKIGAATIIESHGHSAPKEVVDSYVNEKFNIQTIEKDLSDPANFYFIQYHEKEPAGYSKIILNYEHPIIKMKNATMLERLYILKDFYNMKLGFELLKFNIEFSKQNAQSGMWLYVWKGNHKAIKFYEKNGFKIIGSYDFRMSETHINPSHQMLLKY